MFVANGRVPEVGSLSNGGLDALSRLTGIPIYDGRAAAAEAGLLPPERR